MAGASQKMVPGEPLSARRQREGRIEAIAGRQLRLVTTEELYGAGLSPGAIRKRVGNGSLFRIHLGVYATHSRPYTQEQMWLAAVLACGPGALLSDWCSAAHQRMTDLLPVGVHVTVPTGRGRSRRGITVHTRVVDPRDARRVKGVPCTSADRTLMDLAASLTEEDLEILMVAAESEGILRRHRLAELAIEHRGHPGVGKIASLLELEPEITESDLERLFLPVWQAAGVPRPRLNFPVEVEGGGTLKVDLAWPEIRLVVELDSQRFHGDWERAEIDRDRDQTLALSGRLCHRFVRRRVVGDPAATAERLRRLYAIRLAEISRGSPG